MVKTFLHILGWLIVFFLYIKFLEHRSVFFPTRAIEITPQAVNLEYEDVNFLTADGISLHGWFVPYPKEELTFLLFHGNAGNVSHRIDKILLFNEAKVNVFIFDYRGYGNSQGKPSEKGIYIDARAAYGYLVKERKVAPEHIILHGTSLGCAAAIDLAYKEEVGGLIMEGAFSKGRDVAKRLYPFLPSFIFSNSFNSMSKIKEITAPKLFIHSKNDEIIPFKLGKKLYAASLEPKKLVTIYGGHNTAFLDSRQHYLAAVKEFIKEVKK
ncbi:MAG: alpha/beta hydrolase [Candidatus Omnitrophota bacterium]|nr:MAG: alpha/beta hydrolase [Candidatus Omnitrophota bacterium]